MSIDLKQNLIKSTSLSENVITSTLNFSNDIVSPFEYFSNDPQVKNLIDSLNEYMHKRINCAYNSNKLTKIYDAELANYEINKIKNRYSILLKQIPLNMTINKFKILWDDIYFQKKELDNILIENVQKKCIAFDWVMYKFFNEFCQINNIKNQDLTQIYNQPCLNEKYKITKLIQYIESDYPNVIFLQKISRNSADIIRSQLPNYIVNYGNNMAIIHKDQSMTLEPFEKEVMYITNQYELKIGNGFTLLISAYIKNKNNLENLLLFMESDPRTIISAINCDFDIFEEKIDLKDFNVTKSGPTTNKKKTMMQPDYNMANKTNNSSCDFIISNLAIDYVGVFPNQNKLFPSQNKLLPNNEHPFGNYILNTHLCINSKLENSNYENELMESVESAEPMPMSCNVAA